MSSENLVHTVALTFGTSGTSTAATAASATPTTATTVPWNLPRNDLTAQVTANTTGTSGCLATVVWQASNDSVAWFAIASSTASATSAAATAAVSSVAAGVAITAQRFAYFRGVVTVTGTGNASLPVGS